MSEFISKSVVDSLVLDQKGIELLLGLLRYVRGNDTAYEIMSKADLHYSEEEQKEWSDRISFEYNEVGDIDINVANPRSV